MQTWHLVPLTSEARMDDQTPQAEETLSDDELLVEEVSIDGMCGVY